MVPWGLDLMSGPTGAKVNSLVLKGLRIVWPRLVAMRLDLLTVVEGRDLLVAFVLEDAGPRVRGMRHLGYRPACVSISQTRKHLLVANDHGNWYEVLNARTLEPVFTQAGSDAFPCTFATLSGDDVLVSARPGSLEFSQVPSGNTIMRIPCDKPRAFIATQTVELAAGEAVGVVGHTFLDSRMGPLVFRMGAFLEGENELLLGIKRLSDLGHNHVAIGPCGWEEVLLYRETPRLGNRAAEVPGFSVHKLPTEDTETSAGPVLEFVAHPKPLAADARIMATSLAIAAASERGLELVPRAGLAAPASFLPGRAFGFDAEAGRIVLVTPDGGIDVVELPRV